MIKRGLFYFLLGLYFFPVHALTREIALTIDDLPFVGAGNSEPGNLRRTQERFTKIMQTLIDQQVPITGFIIAGTIQKGQWELLEQFKAAGFRLGNHTYSHLNLNASSKERYLDDLEKADKILSPLLTEPRFFRYPYLSTGTGEKKKAVEHYLAEHHYRIAPVTIDSKDFLFNSRLLAIHWRNRPQHLDRIRKQYLDYVWNQTLRAEKTAEKQNKSGKQILLIHANLINAHFLGDIINLYREKGYKLISLEEALEQPLVPLEQLSEVGPDIELQDNDNKQWI